MRNLSTSDKVIVMMMKINEATIYDQSVTTDNRIMMSKMMKI